MVFFIVMLFFDLLIPLIMIVAGYFMYKNPPKKINNVYGYRTKRSKMNQDTWAFAHDYCGRLWVKIGLILMVLSIAAPIPFINSGDDAVGIASGIIVGVQGLVLIASIFPTEMALKREFDKDGKRIEKE